MNTSVFPLVFPLYIALQRSCRLSSSQSQRTHSKAACVTAEWTRAPALTPPIVPLPPGPRSVYCSCGKTYSRHRETIDPQRHMCGVCHGKLSFMGKFDRSGALVSGPGGAAAGKEGKEGEAGGAAGGGAPHAYRQFVKQNFAEVKSSQPPGEMQAGAVGRAVGLWMGSGGGAQAAIEGAAG